MLGIKLTTSISFSLKYQEALRHHHCGLHAQLTRCYVTKILIRVLSVVDVSPTHLLRTLQVRPLAAIVRMRSFLLVDITEVNACHIESLKVTLGWRIVHS